MGRMTKQGIDYFSLDVQFDDKVELYLIEKEAVGLAVMITLYQIIYQNEGYYIKNNKDLKLLIKKRINVSIDNIDECIKILLERTILNKELYKKYSVLTSRGIQKRYFDAAKRKKEVRIIKELILIDIDDYENIKDVDINNENVYNNATKEKVKEKVKEKKDVYAEFVKLTKKEYETCIEKHGETKTKMAIKKLNDYKQSKGKTYKSDYGALNTWVWDSLNGQNQLAEKKFRPGV